MAKVARAAAVWHTYRAVSREGSPGVLARLRAIPRMIRAAASGRYPHLSKARLGALAFAVLYLVSPLDVIPEFLPVIGVVDDFGVLLWLVGSLLGESGRFVEWEEPATARP